MNPSDLIPELCPHCDQPQPAGTIEQHLTTAHANIPPCNATLTNEHTSGTLHCVFRAWHRKDRGEYGEWHVSPRGPVGRTIWDDDAVGATPHSIEEQQPDAPVPAATGATDQHTGLVVQPYRNDRHEDVWVFRCWGTSTCDGHLSLDHHTRQSAERARDRHIAENHAEQTSEVQRLSAELAALREVARGYCPACGRGDAAPTVADWEQQRQRADQAEARLADYNHRITWHTTCANCARLLDSGIRETERATRAETQLDQVRALREDLAGITGARWIADALDHILNPTEAARPITPCPDEQRERAETDMLTVYPPDATDLVGLITDTTLEDQ